MIADALLAKGVLLPSDWTGELGESVTAGLSRWVNTVLGAGAMEKLKLALVYGNDAESMVLDLDHETKMDPDRAMQAGFALTADIENIADTTVGERVRALNEYEESLPGLGWAALAVLDAALGRTIGGCTPSVARDLFVMWSEGVCYDEEEEDALGFNREPGDDSPGYVPNGAFGGDALTLNQFDRAIPAEATCPKRDDERLFRAEAFLRTAPFGWQDWARETVTAAADLARFIGPSGQPRPVWMWNEMRGFDQQPTMPALVRWADGDPTGAMFDDYHNVHWENAELTDVAWLAGFDAADPEKAARAADALAFAVGAAVRCDRLMCLLDGEAPPRGDRLMEVMDVMDVMEVFA